MRRRNPTAFSTEPFSFPEYGLQNLASKRQCPLNCENSLDSTTVPRRRLPASVALSRTITLGARPQRPKTSPSPAHRRSDVSDLSATHCRSFECGSVRTRSFRSRASPATTARKLPKSTWQEPGAHSSSR